MGGSFIKHLGFSLPLAIAVDADGGDPKNPPRDRLPVKGPCSLCRRERTVNYIIGTRELMCSLCIENTFKARKVRNVRSQRRAVDPPVERVLDRPNDEFLNRIRTWDGWFD